MQRTGQGSEEKQSQCRETDTLVLIESPDLATSKLYLLLVFNLHSPEYSVFQLNKLRLKILSLETEKPSGQFHASDLITL